MAKLIGTYLDSGSFRRVSVTARAGRYLVREERLAQPGVVAATCVLACFGRVVPAVREAEVRVLAHGGQLLEDARGMACSRVAPETARELFAEGGMGRFLHIPARPLAG